MPEIKDNIPVSSQNSNAQGAAAAPSRPDINDFTIVACISRTINDKDWPGQCGAIAKPIADPEGTCVVINMFVRHNQTKATSLWSSTWIGTYRFASPQLAYRFCTQQSPDLFHQHPEILDALVKNWTR